MMDVYVQGRRASLDPSASIGKGGEADIFDLGGGVALKLWKGPCHPDIAGSKEEALAAKARIALMQEKMPRFPGGLPDRVVSPIDLVTDKKGQKILGYTMRLVGGAEPLLTLGEPARRRALGGAAATRLLCDLWKTVAGVHRAGVVIGDFNDLNVLVRGAEASIVDADSFQFGGFPCPVYTERFLDPLLCDPAAARPAPRSPFCAGSDWYAFAVMVMTSLLCVGPFGGVHRPKDPSKRVPDPARPLRRVTVFDPEVRYPRPAIPFGVLPDDLLEALAAIFGRDVRAPIPFNVLEALRWTACARCGVEHARQRCPACDHGAPREVVIARGPVKATRRFRTSGVILAASMVGGEPAYVFHEGDTYRREDGSIVLRGPLDGTLRIWIQGKRTYVARGGKVLAIASGSVESQTLVDSVGGEPAFAVNARVAFFVQGGSLFRRAASGVASPLASIAGGATDRWGDVLAGQTRLWVGERLGFGFYRAGGVSVAFTFDTERRGINDAVGIRLPGGQIIAADAAIDERRVWLFLTFMRNGRVAHMAAVIGADGAVLGAAEAEAGDGSWLSSLGGKAAIGGALLGATPGGLVRVELGPSGLEESRRFPDTDPFVDEGSRLLAGRAGLFVVDCREIKDLALG